ncbi:MAG: GNAT family N-acetyltransferase [Clostridia bacterium]|nr:GNAT family N-acetyltransferase [Clostridia bacterium]
MKRIFESERIDFVEVSEQLVPDYLVMVNDIEHVDRFLGGKHKAYTAEQEIAWVQKKLAQGDSVFSMIVKKSGRFIGNIELMDPQNGEAELGVAITAEMQDKGFGSEAIPALIDHGFTRMGLDRIRLKTRTFNVRAIHVYEKCGFREYNRDDEHVYMIISRE